MPVLLVERELLSRLHRLQKVRQLRRRLGKRLQLLHQFRRVRPHARIDFPVRPLDVGRVLLPIFAVEHDLAAVGVFQLDAPPGNHRVVMLRRRVHLDRDRALIVLVEQVLRRIEIMLPHVPQPAIFIIPVPAMRPPMPRPDEGF